MINFLLLVVITLTSHGYSLSVDEGITHTFPTHGYVPPAEEAKKLADLKEKMTEGQTPETGTGGALAEAAINGHQSIVKYLLSDDVPEGMKPRRIFMRLSMIGAAEEGRRDMISYLLSDAIPLNMRPIQDDVHRALRAVAASENMEMVAYLLSDAVPASIRPNQEGVNNALAAATQRGHQAIVSYILNPESPICVRPERIGVLTALKKAVDADQKEMTAYLLSDAVPENIRPDLINIVRLFVSKSFSHSWLITPVLQSVPHTFLFYSSPIGDILRAGNYGDLNYGEEAVHDFGLAGEVHEYADTQVTTSATFGGTASSATASSPKTSGRLNDVVLKMIFDRLAGGTLIRTETILHNLHIWIDNHIVPEQRKTAHLALMNGLEVAYAPRQLQLVYTFLVRSHPERIDTWVAGFINESIEAYKHRDNPLSCTKGITERIVTGLRTIDTELDALFAQAETLFMGKKLMASLNPGNAAGKNFILGRLRELGVTNEIPTAEAIAKLKEHVEVELARLGLTPADGTKYQEQLEIMIGLIQENYDSMIRGDL